MAYKKILFRRDTSANWTSANPVLSGGEIGLETNTNKIKLGDGTTAWTSLPYFYGTLDNSNLNDLGDILITSLQTGDFLRYNGAHWINDPVNLSTDTVGNYVESLTAGTGVTISNNTGEGATPTVAIGQAVGTSASVTFGRLETSGDAVIGGNLTVNGTTTTLNTESLNVEDNFITLNANISGAPTLDAGIVVNRGNASEASLRWNETTDKWELSINGSSYSPIATNERLEERLGQELFHKPVRLATYIPLSNSPTYAAGTSTSDGGTGLNATLTATTYGRLSVDGIQVVTGNRILVKDQVNTVHNGIYVVTAQGGASEYWVLTRADDMNGYYAGQVAYGETMYVASGYVNGLQTFACSSIGSLANNVHVVGTDGITFEQISGIATVTPGNGLTATNNTMNVAVGAGLTVTSDEVNLANVSQSDTTASVATGIFVSDITRDVYGRVTGVTSSSVSVALGSQTTGNYVESLVAGTGVTLSNNSGESATPTIAIAQDVATTASVTFASISGPLTGNASTATKLDTARTISLSGDVTGSASFDGSANATISATIAANSVELGTDTTGNYVSDVTAGTGVTVTHTPGEGSSPTVAIGQSVGTSSSVQFAQVATPSVALPGSTSGTITVQPAAIAGTNTITLPATTGTVVTTGDSGTVTSTMIADGTIVNSDINSSAGIDKTKISGTAITAADTGTVTSTMIADGTIVNADINASAAIDKTKISGTAITAGDTGTVTSTMIADGTIVNDDINASAAIALSKLASGTAGQVVIANASGVPTYTTLSGDVTVDSSGVASIAANSVALGTDTTGNYVASLVAGTGVTLSNNSGEGATPTVAIAQDVSTSASLTFAQVTTTGNLIVGGNLNVSGSVTTVNQTSLAIDDPLIYMNSGSTVTDPDLGFAGNYNDGTYRHAGLFSDASDSHTFKFFKGLTVEPTAPINTAHGSYTPADVSANTFISTVTTGTAPLSVSSSTVVTNLNADYLDGQSIAYFAPVNNASFTGTFSAPTGTITSEMIADGTIVNGDINASAAIALTKLASDTSTALGVGTIELGHASDTTLARSAAGAVTIEGVEIATISSTATLSNKSISLGSNTITGTKAQFNTAVTDDDFAYVGTANAFTANQSVTGTVTTRAAATQDGIILQGRAGGTTTLGVTITPTTLTSSRTLTLPDTTGTVVTTGDTGTVTSTMILDGTIVNADINASAAIDLGKLADVSTNAQTASYTLVLGDKNKIVEMGVASANTLTVPPNSSVAFPVGSQINVLQTGAGQCTITPGAGVTINGTPGLKTRAQWSYATLIKRATDTWVLVGDIAA